MAVLIAVPTDVSAYEQDLSDARRRKAARFRQPADRARCLCAGMALDCALRTVGLREKEVVLAVTAQGKPYLAQYPQWHFSLSHSGNFAVCALSDMPIGVDIEQWRPRRFLPLAERYFTESETAQLRACGEKERQALFYRFWTEKESLLKVTGKGIAELNDCERLAAPYRFAHYPLHGYALTVCTAGEMPATIELPFACGNVLLR